MTKSISITKLKEWNYLEDGSSNSGTVSWSRNGEVHSQISIKVIMWTNPYIEFNYTWQEQSMNYRVYFTTMPSNLGKGQLLYFLCPVTNKRCRKLYMRNGYFTHREATGLIYETQSYSHKKRDMYRIFDDINVDSVYRELHSKHFKKFYNGKPTKRYLKILKKIRLSEQYPMDMMETLLLM